ncbi:LysR family transcriptional regulator [Nitratireductor sp. XY-223]|uniref:LysR family transcriptional regulator n=1 Tax=Nitratireductor sp. XY-223 TaxID=2561926 RepID=UPI0010AA3112|nr:LysR family transcriptional regulator [Nitratireductor sp. XY-223]
MDRNLQAFLAVAETQNITRASDLLALTQPSVTKRLASLEEEFGARLFERHRRGMKLTPAGKVFLEHAKTIEAEYRTSLEKVGAIGAAGLSVLRVGAGPLFHMRFIAPLFKILSDRFPHLDLDLQTDANVRTIPMLIEGSLDVVLGMIEPDDVDESIHLKPIIEIEHGVVFKRGHMAESQQFVTPAHFTGASWVIYTDDPETEKAISDFYLPEETDTVNVKVRTTSFFTGLELVSQGNFVMSAPLQLESVIKAHGLEIRPVAGGMQRRDAGVHVRKSSLGYPAIRVLLDALDNTGIAP